MSASRRFETIVAAAVAALLLPAIVAAHPLGNFTINHYAGLRIAADRIALDVVIDQAEIPTFQERSRIDSDGGGTVSIAEAEAERRAACPRLAANLMLVDGSEQLTLTPVAAGLAFPTGASGAPTMRLVCEFTAERRSPASATASIRFEDRSWPDRIGWREITIAGDGITVGTDLPATSVSERLTVYPTDLLAQPLAVHAAVVTVRPGGVSLAPWSAPDATPLADASASGAIASSASAPAGGAVPGGVAGEISGLLGAPDLTPAVLLLSFLTAIALGAGHALTPGHGKTIMAAYLVGTRGSARHAVGLGLATAVSHTLGVLGVALLIAVAGAALPPERVYPILATASGVIVVVIGAWLLATQVTRWLRAPRSPALVAATVAVGSQQPHRGLDGARSLDGDHGHTHDHAHSEAHDHGHEHLAVPTAAAFGAAHASTSASRSTPAVDPSLHRHGWRVHSHAPATDGPSSLSWRSLFALGLSGGLVPSTSALLILVATVAAGRAAYGVVLVVAFGLGIAVVLVAIGLALVYASGMLSRLPRSSPASRLLALAPTVAALAVLMLGIYLTAQAVGGTPLL